MAHLQNPCALAICEAMGIDPETVKSIVFNFQGGKPETLIIEIFPNEATAVALAKTLKTFVEA